MRALHLATFNAITSPDLSYRNVLAKAAFTVSAVCLTTAILDCAANFFDVPYSSLFTIPVAVCAYYGGLLMGLAAAVLSVLAIDFFILPPAGFSLHLQTVDSILHLTAFAAESIVISSLTARLRSDRIKAEKLAQRNEEALEEIKRQQRIKDEFLALVSHELRTPATTMTSWVGLLKNGKLNPSETDRALNAIERGVRSQVRMIEDLMDISRIAAGKFSVKRRLIEIHPVVESAIEAFRPMAEAKGVEIRVELPAEDRMILADPDRLQQMFANLISNALKFTPSGGLVRVSLERRSDKVVATIRDTGAGIPPGALPHVFERFWQAGDASMRKQGLGLGLAITRHIVEEHFGTITAHSEGEAKGACFTIELPESLTQC